MVGDAVEGEGAGEGGLVDDDELVLGEGGSAMAVFVEPLGGVLAIDPQILGQDLGRGGTRGETDHAVPTVLCGPHVLQCPHGGGLAGSSGADQYIELAAVGGDGGQRP